MFILNSKSSYFACLFWSLVFLIFFTFSSIEIHFYPDSENYLKCATKLKSLFDLPHGQVDNNLLVTGIGYPILLFLSSLILEDISRAVRIAHSLLGIEALFILVYAAKRHLAPFITGAILLFCYWYLQVFFFSALSEWLAFILQINILAFMLLDLESKAISNRILFIVTSWALVVTRLAYSLSCICIVLQLFRWRKMTQKAWCAIILSFLTIAIPLSWINQAVFKDSTELEVSPLFAVGMIVSDYNATHSQDFFIFLNQNRIACDGQENRPLPTEGCYNKNIDLVRIHYRKTSNKTKQTLESLVEERARDLPIHHLPELLNYLAINLVSAVGVFALVFFNLIALFLFRKRQSTAPLIYIVALQGVHLVTICALSVPIFRYQLISQGLLFIVAAFLVAQFFQKSSYEL